MLRSILMLVAAVLPTHLRAQSGHEVLLVAEPLAGGVQYLGRVSGPWHLGIGVAVGPNQGVNLAEDPGSDVDVWGTGYVTVAFRTRTGLELAVSPLGMAAVIGNDFGTVYPSGQLQLSIGSGALRFGTILRTVRIAGGFGTGDWWTEWIPIRVGLRL